MRENSYLLRKKPESMNRKAAHRASIGNARQKVPGAYTILDCSLAPKRVLQLFRGTDEATKGSELTLNGATLLVKKSALALLWSH